MRNGIYPIMERNENGWKENNGNGLAIFEVGDRYNPLTAVVRTLALKSWRTGTVIRLEGNDERPKILYVSKNLKHNRNSFEDLYLGTFLKKDQELCKSNPYIFDDGSYFGSPDRIINTIGLEDIEKYDPRKKFRKWEVDRLNKKDSKTHRTNDWGKFRDLALQFLNLNGKGK